MTLADFYNAVAAVADTDKTKIGAAETKRVLSEAFIILAAMPTADAFDVVTKGVLNAAKKAAKAKA